MSDDSSAQDPEPTPQWQPPVDPTASGSSSPYAPVPAAFGSAPAAPGAPAGWTQPSKPGLIPLRPLGLGNILGASFQSLRRNPRPTLGLAIGTLFLVFLLSFGIAGLVLWATFSRLENVAAENADEVTAGAVLASILSNLLPAVLSAVATALLQGIVVIEVSRAALGEKLTLRQLWSRARGRLWALIGWMMLLVAVVLLAIVLLAAIIAVFVITLGGLGIALGVATGVLGGLGFFAAAVWIGTKVSVVPSALMIERMRLGAAIRRSWSLTNGYFWRTFGIQTLVAVILSTAVQLISTPLLILAPMLAFLIDPNGTNAATVVIVMIAVYLVALSVVLVLTAVTLVVQSAVTGLIYIDLRMRKEGLDLELTRFVEQRSQGTASAADPYRDPAGPSASPSPSGTSPWA